MSASKPRFVGKTVAKMCTTYFFSSKIGNCPTFPQTYRHSKKNISAPVIDAQKNKWREIVCCVGWLVGFAGGEKRLFLPFLIFRPRLTGPDKFQFFFYLRDFLTHVIRRPIEISKLQWSIFVFFYWKMVAKGREGETTMKRSLLIIFLRFPNSWFPRWYRSIITFPLLFVWLYFLSRENSWCRKKKERKKDDDSTGEKKKIDSISCEKKRHLIPFGKILGQAQTILPLFGELGKQLTLTKENLPLRLIFGGTGREDRTKIATLPSPSPEKTHFAVG